MKLAVILGACATALCLVRSVDAGPLAPTKPSELRVLFAKNSVSCPGIPTYRGFVELGLNGTENAFSIPAKSVFVVTSLDYVARTFTPGTQDLLQLIATDGSGGFRLLALCPAVFASDGTAAASCDTSPGIVVKSNATLCYGGSFSNNPGVVVRGFVAKDR